MESYVKLFERFLVFVYRCFDRIVIQGHMPLLSRMRGLRREEPAGWKRCAPVGPDRPVVGEPRLPYPLTTNN